MPLGSLPRALTRAARPAAALLLAVVVVVTAVVLFVTRPDAAPDPTSGTSSARDDAPVDVAPASPPELPSACVAPDELIPVVAMRCDLTPYDADAPTIVLWGDSHAWQMIPALRAAIGDRRINLVGFVFGTCPVVASGRVTLRQRRATECLQSNDLAQRFVRSAVTNGRSVRVVVTEAWELYRDAEVAPDPDEEFETPRPPAIETAAALGTSGTPRLFRFLARLEVPTDVVAPMPMVPTNAPACDDETPYVCALPREAAIKDEVANREQIDALMAGLPSPARLIDPSAALCDTTTCESTVDGRPVFFDDIHVGARFSESLSGYFSETVTALLSTPATS